MPEGIDLSFVMIPSPLKINLGPDDRPPGILRIPLRRSNDSSYSDSSARGFDQPQEAALVS